MRNFIAVLPVLLLCLPALAREVTLTVRNHTGVALTGQPVRGGVPFALGELKEPQARLLDAQGKPLPCSARPLARWYDGSIKWLLVDTQVSLGAGEERKLRLRVGADVPDAPAAGPGSPGPRDTTGPRGVKLEERPDQVVVDTGPARFVFSRKAFGCPSAVWLDRNGDGKAEKQATGGPAQFVCEVEHTPPGPPNEENWLRDAASGAREAFTARADADYQVAVENANPLRAVVKISGWLTNDGGRKLIQYVIRAHACAGKAELTLCPTFIYAGKPKEDFIRALWLRFPRAADGGATWALGGQTRHEGALPDKSAVSLTTIGPEKIYHMAPYDQDKTVTYTVTQDGKQLAEGKEAAGWARLADKAGSLELAVRNFWQMHPKQLKLERGGAGVYLWPDQGGKVLDFRRRYDEVENTYHYDLSLWEFGGEGVGVTHEIALRFGGPADDTAAALGASLDNPLLLQCDPQYLADTRAFGNFAPADHQRFPHLEAVQDVGVAWLQRNQRQFHWDGMIDYGDTLFHGYNTPSHYGYIQPKGWCSRGYVGWLNDDGGLTNGLFVQALRTGDYDTFRTAANMARHSMDVDTCHYCAEEPRYVGGGHRHDQQHWGNGCRGYGTATHGIIDYYLLTGNERALDVARETAQYHDTGYQTEDEDTFGGMIRFWEISGEEHWKQRADELLAQELAHPASPKWAFATTGHFRMVLNTSAGLMYYLSAVPPADAANLREAILNTLTANRDAYMSSWEDAGSYLPLLLVALACDISGDPKDTEVLAALLQRLRLPLKEEVPPDFLTTLRTMPFEQLPDLAIGKWGVNNIYGLELSGFNAYPYVAQVLAKASMDETVVTKVARVNTPAPPFEEIFDPKKIGGPSKWKGKDSFMYTYTLEHGAPDDRVGRSKLILYEDGKELGPAHNGHINTMENGLGRWSHWGSRAIQFSTSDNTDPRTNGRQYKIVNPAP
ncbi:hypothetical protein LLH23_11370 [bacterium]|nr:hypothetical protein [bacterium]